VTYRVVIAPRALADAEHIYQWIATTQTAPLNAARWFDGLFEAIATLKEFPHGCARAPESEFFDREVRQLLHHSHRVLFAIEGDVVEVFHIRHGAMLPLRPEDIGS
jgi:plasmid stabilization system protein ParE